MSNWKTTKCCGTCALWDIESAKTKSGAVRSDAHVQCKWVSTEPYPVSVWPRNQRPVARFIGRDGGEECPCYIARTRAVKSGYHTTDGKFHPAPEATIYTKENFK